MNKKIFFTILGVSILSACSDQSSNNQQSSNGSPDPDKPCIENGDYACKTGDTEPLYPFQWALNYKESFFKDFINIWKDDSDPEDYDVNVESVHKEGIKGQGINVLVLDDGLEIGHEDLSSNVDRNMTYNFKNESNDPTPPDNEDNIEIAHGTNVAGIIAAAQNGKGVMGIAPRVNLGGALMLGVNNVDELAAYGGADFSKNADIINASFGTNPTEPLAYDTDISTLTPLRALANLRKNKGAIFIKASGNEFKDIQEDDVLRDCIDSFSDKLSCENPAHDLERLEPIAIVVAAANAKGQKASYSNAGPVNWITGLGGEFAQGGEFGEGNQENEPSDTDGPSIFSTDLQGCKRGYSRSDATDNYFAQGVSIFKNAQNNLLCHYSQMNGTSAATPTISGVTALILQANPDLTWRDVREILRQSARVIDSDYVERIEGDQLVDLTTGELLDETGTKDDIQDGMTQVPLEFGWQTNGAGAKYSNWYGFGLVDASAAVKLAKTYKAGTLKASLDNIPNFENAFPEVEKLPYGKVTRLGVISMNKAETIDQFQLRVSGPICAGSVGFFVKSPSGVVSALSLPYNIYYNTDVDAVNNYGLGSYAFHGEKSTGQWEIYAVSGNKGSCESQVTAYDPLIVEYRVIPKLYS